VKKQFSRPPHPERYLTIPYLWVQSLRSVPIATEIFLTVGIFAAFSSGSVYAQTIPQTIPPVLPNQPIPNPIQPRDLSPLLPSPQPSPAAPLELPPPVPSEPAQQLSLPGTITVERFEFEGNTAFSDADLAAIVMPFTRRPITFAELLQVEALITKRYTEDGFINSGAVIESKQVLDPKAAVIKVRILEGSLEEIRIIGTKRLNPSYVRSRLKSATAQPLNQNRILKALQVLQLDPLFQSISADLSAGSRPELGVLTIKVVEAKTFDAELFADNGRTPSVGSFRRGVRINKRNLSGIGDRILLEYANTNGSNAFDLGYTVPINARNGTISLLGGVNSTQIIEAPFDSIDITGNSYFIDLSYRQPLIQTPSKELAVGLTASRQVFQTKLLGENFKLSPGADENGKTRTFALRLFQDWTQRSSRDVFAMRSQFNFGLGAFDATINNQPPDSRFFSWRGQAQYVRLVAPQTLLVLRSDVQLSPGALVPTEQFALGGQQSVRGYRQDQLLTDNGIFASAEVRFPILRVERIKSVLQIAPFIDFGMGWNRSGNLTPDRNTLVGVGVGLQWQMGDRLTTRFDWGIPLINVDSEKRTLQEQGLYFSITYSLF
jgi:hemolysin activation/secretion protein